MNDEIIHLSKKDAEFARNQREKRSVKRANAALNRSERFEQNRRIIAGLTSGALFTFTLLLLLILLT
jgi:hypothetical protein